MDKWNITAELAVDREDHPLTESMIYKYITTDRLRFFKGKERLSLDEETLPLESIPQIVLSEVMRDIDLFISVCSIGNDPNWRSDNSKLNKYWETFFYKTINVPTLTRQEILLQILPDLGIAKQCHVGEKFLEVTGRLGTYQIHLSTGSVLIDKKDQSLCILEIPDDNRNKFNVFIPYEDDDYLIVILNKAVMLAYDDEIEDEEIRNQILKRS
ncbi:MAG: hypothetical protein COA45_08555 [Zetaproteobacteria bacterium]|nr:MAG: hypothetical protein COA45_08555 [Zetaproteobacteria bacterium]